MFGYHGNVCKIVRLNFFHRLCVGSTHSYLQFDTKNTIPLWVSFGYKLHFSCSGHFEHLVIQPINTLQMTYHGKTFLFLVVIAQKQLSYGLVVSISITSTSLWGICNNILPPPYCYLGKNAPPLLGQETCAVLGAYTPEMLPW